MQRDITEQAFATSEEGLFDNWFDPIEEALRGKVRGFLAALIEEELTTALGRRRHGRRAEPEAGRPLVGHRHGKRLRNLIGTFGKRKSLCRGRGSSPRTAGPANGAARR